MQTNLNCNCPKPQFGMAVKLPNNIMAKTKVAEYLNLEKNINLKGWKQFKTEQAKLTKFDVEINPETKDAMVYDRLTGEIVDTFIKSREDITGLDNINAVVFPGRKILARIFNPKKFLPYNVYLAGEKAKSLETQTSKTINIGNRL